jgi:hypothetical protein
LEPYHRKLHNLSDLLLAPALDYVHTQCHRMVAVPASHTVADFLRLCRYEYELSTYNNNSCQMQTRYTFCLLTCRIRLYRPMELWGMPSQDHGRLY